MNYTRFCQEIEVFEEDQYSFCFRFLINLFIYLFIYFWLHWVFVEVRGLFIAVASLLRTTGSRHAGFSSCGSQAVERRLSNCGARA